MYSTKVESNNLSHYILYKDVKSSLTNLNSYFVIRLQLDDIIILAYVYIS
jgi:hypothetical protein